MFAVCNFTQFYNLHSDWQLDILYIINIHVYRYGIQHLNWWDFSHLLKYMKVNNTWTNLSLSHGAYKQTKQKQKQKQKQNKTKQNKQTNKHTKKTPNRKQYSNMTYVSVYDSVWIYSPGSGNGTVNRKEKEIIIHT